MRRRRRYRRNVWRGTHINGHRGRRTREVGRRPRRPVVRHGELERVRTRIIRRGRVSIVAGGGIKIGNCSVRGRDRNGEGQRLRYKWIAIVASESEGCEPILIH